MRRPDVLVVGGGAVGVCVAYELARAGADVELVEQASSLGSGCSWGSAGLIAPSHATPLATGQALFEGLRESVKPAGAFTVSPSFDLAPWIARFVASCRPRAVARGTALMRRLIEESYGLHERYAAEGLQTGFEETGVLYLQTTRRGAARARSRHPATGDATLLDPTALREVEPALRGSVAGAVLHPRDARCDPPAFVQAIGRAAATAGARIRVGSTAESLRCAGGDVLVDVDGVPVRPGTVVVAGGVGSRALLKPVGFELLMRAGRGYAIELEPHGDDPRIPLFVEEARALATPLPGRLRLSGVLELDAPGTRFAPRRIAAIRAAVAGVLGGLDAAREQVVWTGLRPLSPDGLPFIGRLPKTPRIVIASGHGMMGMTLAPVTGVLVRNLLENDPDPALDLLAPERFMRHRRRRGHRFIRGSRPEVKPTAGEDPKRT